MNWEDLTIEEQNEIKTECDAIGIPLEYYKENYL